MKVTSMNETLLEQWENAAIKILLDGSSSTVPELEQLWAGGILHCANALRQTWHERDVWARASDGYAKAMIETETELDHARVQLAGCLTAAEGHTSNPAKQSDYGWSLAYQKTLELRMKYEALRFAAQELLNELPVPLPDATASAALELKLVLDDVHSKGES